jgi:hypothetical protein
MPPARIELAQAAIDYAYVTIEEAESAVLDAIVSRTEATELATR